MEFKGTKGEWNNKAFNDSVFDIRSDGGENIGYIYNTKNGNANAKLIACAPEMLEMLNKVKDLFTKRQMPSEHEINMFSVNISELIEKATS